LLASPRYGEYAGNTVARCEEIETLVEGLAALSPTFAVGQI